MAKVLIGAAIGVAIGYLIPPGQFFWFVVGAIGGYLVQKMQIRL